MRYYGNTYFYNVRSDRVRIQREHSATFLATPEPKFFESRDEYETHKASRQQSSEIVELADKVLRNPEAHDAAIDAREASRKFWGW